MRGGRRFMKFAIVLGLVLLVGPTVPRAGDTPYGTPESVVDELYRLVTFGPGTTPDWDQARALFLPEAVIVIRTSRTETGVFSVEGWVQDFIDYIERAGVEKTGFSESIVRTEPLVFGDIAH